MFDLLVDLSNVCRDERLGGPEVASWDRLDRVLVAWYAQVNPASRELLVADQNLARNFRDSESRRRWTQLERVGKLIAVPEADAEILERAASTGASVLARDAYIGHRRSHSWLQGNAEHFWRWSITREDEIEIRLEPLGVANAYSITRAAEKDEMKRLGLDARDLDTGTLSRVYRCTTPRCRLGMSSVLDALPRVVDGRPACPECRGPLLDRGPRPPGRRLKLMDGDHVAGTQNLGDDERVILGQDADPGCWCVACIDRNLPQIGARHVMLKVCGGQLVVEPADLGLSTQVQRWANGAWGAPEELTRPTTLLARDRIVLPHGLRVEQSARRYVVPDFY